MSTNRFLGKKGSGHWDAETGGPDAGEGVKKVVVGNVIGGTVKRHWWVNL